MKYSIARQFEKNRELRADNFILVYQMGKVGSSSIEHTLEARNIPSYHIHTFDDHEEFHMYHNKKDVSKFFDFKNRAMYRLVLNQRKRILQKREQIKIVTLIRDPIATVFSRFPRFAPAIYRRQKERCHPPRYGSDLQASRALL